MARASVELIVEAAKAVNPLRRVQQQSKKVEQELKKTQRAARNVEAAFQRMGRKGIRSFRDLESNAARLGKRMGGLRGTIGKAAIAFAAFRAVQTGIQRVEYWLRKVEKDSPHLTETSPELLQAPWKPCSIEPPPDWDITLPEGVSTREVLGFDPRTGNPTQWPLRYGMAAFSAEIPGLQPGKYEVRARAVDLNGFPQPEPRPYPKSGKNVLKPWTFTVS